MVLGELIQNEGEFLADIVTATEALLAEPIWILSAHDRSLDYFYGRAPVVDLASSHRGMTLALVSVLLEPVLPDDLVARMRQKVEERVLEPYRIAAVSGDIPQGLWWMRTTNNWNAVCHNGVAAAALVIEDDPEKRAEILAGIDRYLPFFLDGFTDDGYCSEGLGYWNYGYGNFAMLSEWVRRATDGRQDWLHSDKAVAAALFPFRLEMSEDTFPIFADGTIGSRPNPVLLDYLARRIDAVDAVRDGSTGLGASGFLQVVSYGLAGRVDQVLAGAEGKNPWRDVFKEAGVLILRPGNTGSRISLALKAGHNNEHHNHNDVGSVVVAVDNTQLITDPGAEVYTARTFSSDRYVSNMLNSYGHSLPRIGNTLQSKGEEHRGILVATEYSDELDRAVIDLAPAYEVDGLLELTREVTYSRQDEGSVTMTDSILLESAELFETALITYGRWEQKEPGRALLFQGDAALEITWASTPVDLNISTTRIDERTRHGSLPLRIAFTAVEPVTEASITIEMRPTDSPISYEVDMSPYKPRLEKAVRVQAESFSGETGGAVMITRKVNADGEAFKNWDAAGHAVTWEFQVASGGDYALRLRYCHPMPGLSLRTIAWKGVAETGMASFPSTGGWSTFGDDWSTVYAGLEGEPYVVHLEEGLQELTLTNKDGRSLNLDWIELVPISGWTD
ncbi:MAG: hypothetical protein DRP71_06095 [Verrucomicrobia bacterium]|nr:MAG: hypothetical protein DRP71_06095 [Verrucomicrobiota bacterium]